VISAEKVPTGSSGAILGGDTRARIFSTRAIMTTSLRLPTAVWVLLAVGLVASVLALIPGLAAIPPQIESDYAYQLLAADRFLAGYGFTTLQPIAPGQPWDFQYEWGFLTKWPVGYSMLVAAVRSAFSCSAIQASRVIGIVACAFAMVGWFIWSRRMTPSGVSGLLIGVTAVSAGLVAGYLINPSTDVFLVAAIPFLLLCTHSATVINETAKSSPFSRVKWLALAGLLSGSLFWLRYASVFIPAGIGSYLIWTWLISRRAKGQSRVTPRDHEFTPPLPAKHIVLFACSAAIPIVALLLTNQLLGSAESLQAQVNLGHRVGFNMSLSLIWQAWWQFTDLGYYNHHAISHWAIALWPGCLLVISLLMPAWRRVVVTCLSQPAARLCACVLLTFLTMIILVTAMFGDKFDFVNLARYYTPLRPMYFLLFVAPLAFVSSRLVRCSLCLALLICCSWTSQQQWLRTYHRWARADRVTSPYGAWSRCFEPESDQLFSHLRSVADDHLILVSNFHEYLAMETALPTLPIPTDQASLNRWVSKISASRRIEHPRVMFVLDSDNQWRDYWIKDRRKIETEFALRPLPMDFGDEGAKVYLYTTGT